MICIKMACGKCRLKFERAAEDKMTCCLQVASWFMDWNGKNMIVPINLYSLGDLIFLFYYYYK